MASTRPSADKRSAPLSEISTTSSSNSRRRSNNGQPVSVSKGRQSASSSRSEESQLVVSEQAFGPTLARASPLIIDPHQQLQDNTNTPIVSSTQDLDPALPHSSSVISINPQLENDMAAGIIIRQARQLNSKSFQPSPHSRSWNNPVIPIL
jgi:hypothetical protein